MEISQELIKSNLKKDTIDELLCKHQNDFLLMAFLPKNDLKSFIIRKKFGGKKNFKLTNSHYRANL